MKARRAISILLLGVQSACLTGPRRVSYSPKQYLALNQPKEVWLTLKDGSQAAMVSPRLISDTLFGWNTKGNEDLTIAVSDIKELKARRLSVIKTAAIPTAIVGAAVAVGIIASKTSGAPSVIKDTACVGNSCLGGTQ